MLFDIYQQDGKDRFNGHLLELDQLLKSDIFLGGLLATFDKSQIDINLLNSFAILSDVAWALEMMDF